MCRLLGIVASHRRDFRLCLTDAPHSLRTLSCEHSDGWGVAVHDGQAWTLHKHPASAEQDPFFGTVAQTAKGDLLIAHIRKRTVGPITLENTHPFRSGRWVFAHNGTINDLTDLRRAVSQARRDSLQGDTDSELLFAYLLSELDAGGLTDEGADELVASALATAVQKVAAWPQIGAINFVLSSGTTLYAYRQGRPLFLLERWREQGERLACVAVASEPITEEPWRAVPERTLLRLTRFQSATALPESPGAPATADLQ